MNEPNSANPVNESPNRRDLLRFTGCAAGASALTLATASSAAAAERPDAAYPLDEPANQIYSSCLQCNTGCGIKVKVQDGVIVKIDGNPYDPFNMVPSLPMRIPVNQTARIDAPLCPKGQAGLQSHYDPYRIRQVLKRSGPRGAGQWRTIPFDQAIQEIVDGGRLFSDVAGEETREVPGLRSLQVLRDPAVFTEMGRDASAVGKRTMTLAAFQERHRANLNKLIDPAHPDFGPKNNQFAFMWGRMKDGRGHLVKRMVQAFGSNNAHGHTTVCQGSLYFTGKAMSEQWMVEEQGGRLVGKFDKGDKFYFQIDTENAEFVLFVGANLLDGNYGPTNRAPRVTERIANGQLKIAVVDPRFSKLASKASNWHPINPGTDGAFAMGLARWIFERQRFDRRFLGCANKAAAAAASESCWNNGSWLVKIDAQGRPGAFVRADELRSAAQRAGMEARVRVVGDPRKAVFVVKQGEQFVCFDPDDAAHAVTGDLFAGDLPMDQAGGPNRLALPRLNVGDLRLATGLDVFRASAFQCTLAQYSAISGIAENQIARLAFELTNHGKKAGIDIHRGVSQHTNGFYNVLAFYAVNALIGNYGWAGGSIKATTYKADGSGRGQPYPLSATQRGFPTPFGINILRHNKYEDTTFFDPARGAANYPARRNWWPHATDIYQEILPSIGEQYPYPIQVLFSYMAAAPYSLPGGQTNIAVLRDVNKLPLHFTSDITIGEMSMYADYIFPDLSYLERWEFQGSHPNMPIKVQPIRQPAGDFGNVRVRTFGEEMPCSFEAIVLALAEKLGLPGFGANGLGAGNPLNRPEDLYLKMVANVALDGSPAPDANEEEQRIFREARRHLPANIFDENRWKQTVTPAEWPKVVFLLNRGGRFEDYANAFRGPKHAHAYDKLLSLYCEKVNGFKNAFTGRNFPGYPCYLPIADVSGRPLIELETDHPFTLLTHRHIAHTKSRTISNYWLLALLPDNGLLINPRDAASVGVRNGDRVKIVSATNPQGVWELGPNWNKPMIGKVKLTETIKPGCVSFTLGHGHWAMGASDMVIDGRRIAADPRRAEGVHANAAMWLDPVLRNTCLLDPIGGSVSFYDSKVRLEKV